MIQTAAPVHQQPESVPFSARHLVDLLVCLIIAVCLMRTFEVEGYMISTGSMAPGLLGYHKRVVCPTCGFHFPLGVAFDDSVSGGSRVEARSSTRGQSLELCTCPNCLQSGIDVAPVPRNQGDQLLVHKNAFLWQTPRRWEIVVFRNPAKPTQAYVKRAVGLPGERVRVFDGDVLIDGRIARKTPAVQRDMRIAVYDHAFQPEHDVRWLDRWTSADSGWTVTSDGFESHSGSDGVNWLVYRHSIRRGGRHQTRALLQSAMALEDWKRSEAGRLTLPLTVSERIRFDHQTRELVCVGVMPERLREKLLESAESDDFRAVVRRLAEQSRFAPITDAYGYNGRPDENSVKDLMLAANIRFSQATGRVVVRMSTGFRHYDCVLDADRRVIALSAADARDGVLRSVDLPAKVFDEGIRIEVSTFDRQVTVTVDGNPAFEPWPEEDSGLRPELGRSPVRIGAGNASVELSSLQLFRDVHYTTKRARNAVDKPYQLADDEYFMLGDNSPVSSDSRFWGEPAVASRLLIGKPFLLHLPSKPGRLRFGEVERYVRVPDLSRVRHLK